jgi:hypothetical protein
MNSDVLIESKSLRNSYVGRVAVLDKVKALSMLPDNENVSVEMAAEYYEVGKEAINSLIKDNREELVKDDLTVLVGTELKSYKDMGVVGKNASAFTVIPRRALLRIGMMLRDSLVARAVRDYLLNREQEAPQRTRSNEPDLIHFKKEAFMLEVTADMLRLPDSGRLKLLGDFNKQHGLAIPLPAYADEPGTESASELLKKNGIAIQAKAFNILFINHGIMEEKTRPSTKGGSKRFKSLTDSGLDYGKNIVNPNSPRETAPHYFPDRFPELLKKVGLMI